LVKGPSVLDKISFQAVGMSIVIVLALLIVLKPLFVGLIPSLGSLKLGGAMMFIGIVLLLYTVFKLVRGNFFLTKETFMGLLIAIAIIVFILLKGNLDTFSVYKAPLQALVGGP